MASFHQTIIVGNLGNDVDLRYLPNGDAVANFSVAVTEHWKDQSGGKQERTTWYRVNAFRRLAEICGEYLKKGSSVMIVGKMQSREWEKDGVKRVSWELLADSMQMLGGRPQGQDNGQGYRAARDGTPAQKPAPSGPNGGGFQDFEDDLPFAPYDERTVF